MLPYHPHSLCCLPPPRPLQNLKEGRNNNIRCWSCNSHFCYLCRTWLRNRPGAHFGTGAGRCKQHTDD